MKTIPDFPNYKVDKDGRVFNKNGKCLKQEISRNGYCRVSLSNEFKKHVHKLVHRLVAEAYLSNPYRLPQVNHRNQNKLDNNVENLEWCMPLDNLLHSEVINKASLAKQHEIICLTTGEHFTSLKQAAEKYGLNHSNIAACCKGRRKTTGNKEWRYANETS